MNECDKTSEFRLYTDNAHICISSPDTQIQGAFSHRQSGQGWEEPGAVGVQRYLTQPRGFGGLSVGGETRRKKPKFGIFFPRNPVLPDPLAYLSAINKTRMNFLCLINTLLKK